MLLSIEKLIYGGDGLARTPPGVDGRSMAVFVPFVLPGERVDVEIRQEKPGFARALVAQLILASPDRVEARCPYFRQCGGCHYQHVPYERQLEFKAEILRETLQRIAKVELKSEIRLHGSPPWNYRNRTRLQVQTVPEFALGYLRFGSHEFLPVCECPISSPLLNRVIARLHELRGLNCPAAVEEIELFADGADERLLAWAFFGLEADKRDLLRWAEALERELPEIAGVTFFSSRRQTSKRPPEDDAAMDPKALTQSGAKSIRCILPGEPLSHRRTDFGRDRQCARRRRTRPVRRSGVIFRGVVAEFSSHIGCRGVTDSVWRSAAECTGERESGRRANRGLPEERIPKKPAGAKTS